MRSILYIKIIHILMILRIISPILLVSIIKYIEKLSHASLHLLHKICCIHISIIYISISIKVE
jgi:hypothetical protein